MYVKRLRGIKSFQCVNFTIKLIKSCTLNAPILKMIPGQIKQRRRTFSYADDDEINSFMEQRYGSTCQRKELFPTIPGQIPKITCSTLAEIISGKYNDYFKKIYIIDYRFKYEFDGGHIKNAIWLSDISNLQEMFFDKPIESALIIFHCEFSHNRGPAAASAFRSLDRTINLHRYPYHFYPDVYILHGGYSEFYQEYPELCDGGYTPMYEKSHRKNGDLVRSHSYFKSSMKLLKTSLSLSSNLLLKETFSSSPRNNEEEEDSQLANGSFLAFTN